MKARSLFCSVLLVLTPLLFSQGKPLKVLFVGNSYTYGYNMPHLVSIIAGETSVPLIVRKSVAPGARLAEHWEGKRNLNTREVIANGGFDIVVLQAQSMAAINSRDEALSYITRFANYNQLHGAKTYLFNTWAREKVPQFQQSIDAMYRQAARENRAVRVPVGEAWALAMDLRPMVDLYTSDGSHPNELGSMLTAAMFVKVICGELPEKLPGLYRIEDADGESVRLMNHNVEDAEFCRRIVNAIAN